MSDPIRLRYFMENVYGHSVITVNTQDWKNVVRLDGSPTRVEQILEKLSRVMRDAEVVAVAASGIANPNPGIDIVRKDPKDSPTIYNTDHYTVVERLTGHPDYSSILKRTKVEDSKELQETLNSWVWIIGPEQDPANHWTEEIPEYIKNAKQKP
ncbi:MAG TPA: hypothetical protein VH227_04210 [Candidatus Udaeobacter sp.]|nr:hypothetical protein [Candidatus Udaeobacter sp.]